MSQPQQSVTLTPVTGWGRVSATIEPHVDAILALYVEGFSFRAIVEQLQLPLTGSQVRKALMRDHIERWDEAVVERAHELIERNGEHAASAASTGEASGFKAAAEINFKLAALYDSRRFGDKRTIELTGANGGALKVEADIKLSPDEAYKRMLRGES